MYKWCCTLTFLSFGWCFGPKWLLVLDSLDRTQHHRQNLTTSCLWFIIDQMGWGYVCPKRRRISTISMLCIHFVFLVAGNLKNPEHFRYNEETSLAWMEGRLSDDIVEEQRKVEQADLIIFQVSSYISFSFFLNVFPSFALSPAHSYYLCSYCERK